MGRMIDDCLEVGAGGKDFLFFFQKDNSTTDPAVIINRKLLSRRTYLPSDLDTSVRKSWVKLERRGEIRTHGVSQHRLKWMIDVGQ